MRRVKTFVKGFDEVLRGGIPAGTVTLVAGTTGTMKSAFVYSILYHNACAGSRALYVALEQQQNSLFAQMKNFGWSLENVRGSFTVLDRYAVQEHMQEVYRRTFFEILLEHLVMLKSELHYTLLAIDCISALETLAELRKPRFELFKFMDWLRKLETTSFIVSEMSPDSNKYAKYDESFLSDGIIHMKMEEVGETSVQRRIRCVKLRNSAHSTDWFALLFKDGMFEITRAITR
jgi:KaiC/GvpD/RAD55 family RecA-like ATPase